MTNSFSKILPSNSSVNRFPNNNASSFSIAFDDAEELRGNWEVAVSHVVYSNCLYTFSEESVIIQEGEKTVDRLGKSCRVIVPMHTEPEPIEGMAYILDHFNKVAGNIIKFELVRTKWKRWTPIKWKLSQGWLLCLSPRLRRYIGLAGNVLTPHDNYAENEYNLRRWWKNTVMDYSDNGLYIDFIKITPDKLITEIEIKEENKEIDINEVVRRFNSRLMYEGKQIAELEEKKTNKYSYLSIKKKYNDNIILVTSKDFHSFLRHHTAALYGNERDLYYDQYSFANQINKKWSVLLYRLPTIQHINFADKIIKRITIPSRIIKSTDEAVKYLNSMIKHKNISFSVNHDIASLAITGNSTFEMDDTLRDILAFNENSYKGPKTFKAEDVISLSRRIHFFQIYSNIGADVSIGDVQAPILTVIPFNMRECNVISERQIKKLQYVDLRSNYIPRIDIDIYDDNGKYIPFEKDAISMVTLHFRRKY